MRCILRKFSYYNIGILFSFRMSEIYFSELVISFFSNIFFICMASSFVEMCDIIHIFSYLFTYILDFIILDFTLPVYT